MLIAVADSVNSIAQFLTVLVLFVFVLCITYFTTRYIAGYQKAKIKTANMELMESLRISNNKYLQIVRAGERYLVIAVCKDTVTLLAEMKEEELTLDYSGGESPLDFKGFMDKAKSFYPKNKGQDTDKGY